MAEGSEDNRSTILPLLTDFFLSPWVTILQPLRAGVGRYWGEPCWCVNKAAQPVRKLRRAALCSHQTSPAAGVTPKCRSFQTVMAAQAGSWSISLPAKSYVCATNVSNEPLSSPSSSSCLCAGRQRYCSRWDCEGISAHWRTAARRCRKMSKIQIYLLPAASAKKKKKN